MSTRPDIEQTACPNEVQICGLEATGLPHPAGLAALRKQKLVEKHVDREGFAELIAALQADVSFVRAQLEQARLDHQTCQHEMALVRRETEVLRQQVAILSQRAIPALDGPVPASVLHEG